MNVFELFGTIAINNRGANEALNDTAQKAERTGSRIQKAFKNIGSASLKIGKTVVGGATAIATAFAATVETTRDYRTAMAKLDTAFVTNGHSSRAALETYKALQGVLGETDQAVEAANHLAVMCENEKDLARWTDICTGVYATFGDSLPIEGLTESANETSKVGQVTGSLADALNWAGISEDDFNLRLRACTSEQERQDLIMNALNDTYKTAAEQYKETNKEVIAAHEAQDKLNSAMGKLGEIGEPIMTAFKTAVADAILIAAPHLETMANGFLNIETHANNAITAVQNFCTQHIVDPISGALATMGGWFENIIIAADNAAAAVANFFGIQRSNYMPTQSVDEYFAPSSGYLGEYANGWGNDYSFDSSNAVGLDRVPRDGWLARVHKDEAILDKTEADAWRGGGTGRIEALLTQLVANTAGGQQVVLDSGILVGQLAPQMDARLGTISSRKGRGN
mgnify:CR=1 FL=1